VIFGFNTEVIYGATCYHLQSEFRARERLLQTQVFVTGQCLGKVTNSAIAERDEAACQHDLREQHRAAVTAAREGRIEQWLRDSSSVPCSGVASRPELSLELVNNALPWCEGSLKLEFRVSNAAVPVASADVEVATEDRASRAASLTTAEGVAAMALAIAEADLENCVLVVTARPPHSEAATTPEITRRFRLR
jgi:hypothetical protein